MIVEDRGGYSVGCLGMHLPSLGSVVAPGNDIGAVVVWPRHVHRPASVAIAIDTPSNSGASVTNSMRQIAARVMAHARAAGAPRISHWYAVDSLGRVNAYDLAKDCFHPVAVTWWPVSSVDALARHHELGAVLWMELCRFVDSHLATEPDRYANACKASVHGARPEIAQLAQLDQAIPAVGFPATVLEQDTVMAATIVSVSGSPAEVGVKRDLVMHRTAVGADLVAAHFIPTCYTQTEVFSRRSGGAWVKRGAGEWPRLVVGVRLAPPMKLIAESAGASVTR
jgi:hypothetical protein